jgi:alpha-L-fucosidase
MDFANDDNFTTSWNSNKAIDQPWYEVQFRKEQSFSMVSIVEPQPNVGDYKLEYFEHGTWKLIPTESKSDRVKIHRFKHVSGTAVRVTLKSFSTPPSISEMGVYSEKQ